MSPFVRVAGAVVGCAAMAVAGCAPKPAATPESAFVELQKAQARREFGVVFDMMSSAHQKEFADGLAAAAAGAGMPAIAKQVLGFDPAELAKLPPREAFVRTMAGLDSAGKFGAALGGKQPAAARGFAGATVSRCDVRESAASMTVDTTAGAVAVDLVREGGTWKFGSGVAPVFRR